MVQLIQSKYITLSSLFFVFYTSACLHHPYEIQKTTTQLKGIHPYTKIDNNKDVTKFNERVSDEFKKEILEPFLISPLHTMVQDVTPVNYTRDRLSTHFFNHYCNPHTATKNLNDEKDKQLFQDQRTNIIHEGIQLAWYYVYVGKYIHKYYEYHAELIDAQKMLPGPILGMRQPNYHYTNIDSNPKIVEFNTRISDDFLKNILKPFLESQYHTLIYYYTGERNCSPYYYTLYRLNELEQQDTTYDTVHKKKHIKTIIYEGMQLAWYYTCIGKYIHSDRNYLRPLEQLQELKEELLY